MKILVTGTAGFIGFHLAKKLMERGDEVIGLDCINDYYDINIKYARLKISGIDKEKIAYNQLVQSNIFPNYSFIKLNLEDYENMKQLFENEKFDKVVNLAAQAGVRYSMENPQAYIQSNIVGFTNILECCRHYNIKHLAYASSSSVYGLNKKMPLCTSQNIDHPMSLYAASKKSNELMAHTYSHLYDLSTTGLRFFTVYGPWGRPDMALFLFTKAMLANQSIKVFNYGEMVRDFTYIDDIVEGITRVLDNPAKKDITWDETNPNPASSSAPYKVYNIGNNNPVTLLDFIKAIEKELGIKAKKNMMPLQAGDVVATYANVLDLVNNMNYKPETTIEYGIKQFIDWYMAYFKVEKSTKDSVLQPISSTYSEVA